MSEQLYQIGISVMEEGDAERLSLLRTECARKLVRAVAYPDGCGYLHVYLCSEHDERLFVLVTETVESGLLGDVIERVRSAVLGWAVRVFPELPLPGVIVDVWCEDKELER